MNRSLAARSAIAALALATPALAQWNPAAGQWLKTDSRDLRVMVWNIHDEVCSTTSKVEGLNGWCAVAREIAALQPDVLVMEECGDNSGNGTGSGVDSVANLTTTLNLLLHGGTDTFNGSTAVTAYVQKYAASYDLPYVFVSSVNDGFNRNVLLSRYPFVDLTGDTKTVIPNFTLLNAAYAPGGDGGIRGFIWAEINLPDASYGGNVVIGGCHLRSGSDSSDLAERLTASKNIAYFIDAMFNGLGGATPDPSNVVLDSPAATSILNSLTPAIWGGDFNENEATNGRDGPALWMTRAQNANPGGTDGTDRDRSDSTYDSSVDPINGNDSTFGSSTGHNKLDYMCWQDSIAVVRRTFTFNSGNYNAAAQPSQLNGFSGGAVLVSSTASDHRPVIGDFILPVPAPGPFSLSSPADNALSQPLTPALSWTASSNAATYTLKIADNPGLSSPILTASGLTSTTYNVPGATLATCSTYYWGVTAVNGTGSAASSPASFSFITYYPADFNGDGFVTGDDFDEYVVLFEAGDPGADFNGDTFVTGDDFDDFANHFVEGC